MLSIEYVVCYDCEEYKVILSLKVLGKIVGLCKLQRERINCTSVYLFLYGESNF